MASTIDTMTRERFAELVETYGGDIDRWPQATRSQARRLLAGDAPSVRLLAEVDALDRLLALAPVTAPSAAMTDQIVARARRERAPGTAMGERPVPTAGGGDIARGTGKVVPLSNAPLGRFAAPASGRGQSGGIFPRRHVFGGGGMLAASLLIGIWLGASGTASPSFSTAFPERQATKTLDAMSEIVQSALPVDLIDGTDEDTL